MAKKNLTRNTLVLSSLEGKNNLGKGGVMTSVKDKERYNRSYQKQIVKKEMNRSDSDRSCFFIFTVYLNYLVN